MRGSFNTSDPPSSKFNVPAVSDPERTFFIEFLPILSGVGDSVVVLAFGGLDGQGGASVTVITRGGEGNWG